MHVEDGYALYPSGGLRVEYYAPRAEAKAGGVRISNQIGYEVNSWSDDVGFRCASF